MRLHNIPKEERFPLSDIEKKGIAAFITRYGPLGKLYSEQQHPIRIYISKTGEYQVQYGWADETADRTGYHNKWQLFSLEDLKVWSRNLDASPFTDDMISDVVYETA